MRILIAEDDLMSRKYLLELLEKYGECDLAIDGLETLEAYRLANEEKKPYKIICLDIMMPRVDGVKVLKAIRDLEKRKRLSKQNKVKIIMTTALAETQYVQEAYRIGCDAYFTKPIDQLELLHFVEKIKDG